MTENWKQVVEAVEEVGAEETNLPAQKLETGRRRCLEEGEVVHTPWKTVGSQEDLAQVAAEERQSRQSLKDIHLESQAVVEVESCLESEHYQQAAGTMDFHALPWLAELPTADQTMEVWEQHSVVGLEGTEHGMLKRHFHLVNCPMAPASSSSRRDLISDHP